MRIIHGFTKRVVIDTNVLISAMLSPSGTAARFMGDVFDGQYEVMITETILREYDNVMRRPQFRFDAEDISFVNTWFLENAVLVEVDEADYPRSELPDQKDAAFYVAARCTGALLVTGNIKHYPVTEWRTMIWELV